MITAKDLATELQLSVSTVGRALADDPRISTATKQRVQQTAARMGYVANHAARMMRGASSNLVGLVVPDIRNSFYSTIAHALSKCLESAQLQLTLSETDDDGMVELRHLRELASANVAGIIIVPSARPHPDAVRLLENMPHIQLLRQHPALGKHCFGIDDAQALQQATSHLFELGHRRIAYIGGSSDLSTGAARLAGFRLALAGTDAAPIEELGPPSATEVGRAALRRLLALSTPPTAIITGSVQITQGVLEQLLESDVRVPEQLSVVGFGDEPGFRWWGPGLTTLAMPMSELATACGLWFVHQLQSKSVSSTPYRALSSATLVLRGSTSPPRSSATMPAATRQRYAAQDDDSVTLPLPYKENS
jgi:LacI family transcriptional regulator